LLDRWQVQIIPDAALKAVEQDKDEKTTEGKGKGKENEDPEAALTFAAFAAEEKQKAKEKEEAEHAKEADSSSVPALAVPRSPATPMRMPSLNLTPPTSPQNLTPASPSKQQRGIARSGSSSNRSGNRSGNRSCSRKRGRGGKQSSSSRSGQKEKVPQPQISSMNNYFGIGVDAQIAHDFHKAREAAPHLFYSRLVNKLWYASGGVRQFVTRKFRNFPDQVEVYVDGSPVPLVLPEGLEGIIILNIGSFGGGSDLSLVESGGCNGGSAHDATQTRGTPSRVPCKRVIARDGTRIGCLHSCSAAEEEEDNRRHSARLVPQLDGCRGGIFWKVSESERGVWFRVSASDTQCIVEVQRDIVRGGNWGSDHVLCRTLQTPRTIAYVKIVHNYID
jgi:hypothetical protein